MAARANLNRDVAAALQNLLEAYDAGGGSTTYNMVSLRGSFAQTIPFEDPNFQRHFSLFATEAVARDFRANRFIYPIGGHPPDPAIPIRDSIPYILPLHLLQRPSDEIQFDREGVEEGEVRRREEEQQQHDIPGAQEEREGGVETEEGREGRMAGVRQNVERTVSNKRRIGEDTTISSDKEDQDELADSNAAHVFTFIKTANVDEIRMPVEAQKITKLVLEYRTNDFNAAVLAFCWKSGKHHDFPDALVRDLLQYKFINLEKINAGPNACKFDIYSKSKDSDPASKIKPKAFKEATEWRDAVTLLVETLSIAFVSKSVTYIDYFLFFIFIFIFIFKKVS